MCGKLGTGKLSSAVLLLTGPAATDGSCSMTLLSAAPSHTWDSLSDVAPVRLSCLRELICEADTLFKSRLI